MGTRDAIAHDMGNSIFPKIPAGGFWEDILKFGARGMNILR